MAPRRQFLHKTQSVGALLIMCTLGLALSLTSRAGGDQAANLLPNPSFEQGTATPDGWQLCPWGGAKLTRDTTVARTGAASARVGISPEGAAEYPCFKYVQLGAKPGEAYHGTVFARTRGMTDIGAYIAVEYYAGDKRLAFDSSEFTGPGDRDWMRLAVDGIVPPGADRISLCLAAHGQGQAWFDDATLERTLSAPAEFAGDRITVRVQPEVTINARFLGFGSQGDYFLTRSMNTARGVNDDDRKLVLDRVAEMRPQIIRTFFDYKWWEPEPGQHTPDSEAMRDYIAWVRFLKGLGTSVLLCPWGDCFASPAWMRCGNGRLPAPEEREAMICSLADLVQFLRRDQGLDNVRYVCLMNEPDNDPNRAVPPEEHIRLCRLLDAMLRERGVRGEVSLLGSDDCQGSMLHANRWFRETLAGEHGFCDGFSSHTYQHQYTPALVPWVKERLDLLKAASSPPKPLLITEFGYGGSTFDNPVNGQYEYGLFLGDFAITALNAGASAALQWCLMDTYYDDTNAQHWGLWQYKDKGWQPRPGFYAWSLVTRYTRADSRVVKVTLAPEAGQVRAAALVAPDGRLTVMLVNRLTRPMQVSVLPGLKRTVRLRVHEYAREAAEPAGVVEVEQGGKAEVALAAEAFVVLTEQR